MVNTPGIIPIPDHLRQPKRARLSLAVIAAAFLVFVFALAPCRTFAEEQRYSQEEASESSPPQLSDNTLEYVIYGEGREYETGGYFMVPEDYGTADKPVTIILDNVNVSQEGMDPEHSFIHIKKGSHVLIRLRGTNRITAGKNQQFGSDDGMACIHVSEGATLTIDSDSEPGSNSGKLIAKGGGDDYGGAAIGTRYNEDCGTIIINGGTIEARGARSAAGIGGGRDGDANTITIRGGDITAHGGEYGCGIGSGNHVGVSSNDGGDLRGPITISGGSVKAYGGRGAAGIGSSDEGKFYGGVLISGGDVTAEGGSLAPGIGSGNDASFHDNAKVRITGGSVNAKGGVTGAGIGGGCETNGTVVEIEQAEGSALNVTATGGTHSAGIGSADRNLKAVKIDLRGGTVRANGGENGAGIGSGESTNPLYTANALSIDISGTGTIVAHGGRNGAGIGAGNDSQVSEHIIINGDNTAGGCGNRGQALEGGRGLDIEAVASYGRNEGTDDKPAEYENEAAAIGSGKATCGDISISNAVLHTKADCQGADIGGGGYHVDPSGAIANITINNCEIVSESTHKVAPGIGAGYGGTVHNITISNSRYTGSGIGGAPMDWNYTNLNDVNTITITNSDIHAEWDEKNPGKFVGNLIPTDNPMDHGAAGIGSGQYGDMGKIIIDNCNIYARGFGSGAGIGGGGAGGSNYSLIPVKKLDIGDTHEIDISHSTVTAYSGCAKLTDYGPVDLWDGYTHYKIELTKFGGGAGIGSGSASSMTDLTITDCDRVYARGYKGCGVGAGCGTGIVQSGGADHIILERIGSLEAYGGDSCAGIGTGGGEGLRTTDGSVLNEIFISECNVKAEGGKYAAGIGLGDGSKYRDDGDGLRGPQAVTIEDSSVEAKGGPMGAGIGGGYENRLSRTGGDNPPILIRGKCRVKAYGGPFYYFDNGTGSHGGGAGIGGGSGGGGGYIEIDVDETENAAKGTMDAPEASDYYVYAAGGDGAAGIGSAGDIYQIRTEDNNNSDSDTVIIRGGAVFAKGGDTYDAAAEKDIFTSDRMMGAGAGIGGGSAQSKIRHIGISGGYIIAQPGKGTNENDSAYAIGCGGNYSDKGGTRDCGDLIITDGTVIADTVSRFSGSCIIAGGSVSPVIDNAKDYNGRNVYRTVMKLPDHPRERVGIKTSQPYGANHIYTRVIEAGSRGSGIWVYLYLPQKSSKETCVTDGVFEAEGAQWADMTVGSGDASATRHYYGWTDAENTGLLKLEGRGIGVTLSSAEGRDYVGYGDVFRLMLKDGTLSTGNTWTFTADGAASLTEEGQNPVSLGAYASLHADRTGSFSFHGVCANSPDDMMYWGTVADYSAEVQAVPATVEISEDLTKVYDGTPVNAAPTVETNSSGSITYEWYSGSRKLREAPVDAGEYRVVANVAASGIFSAGSAERTFSIIPAAVTVKQSASGSGSGANISLSAEAFGLYARDTKLGKAQKVKFIIEELNEDGTPKTDDEGKAVVTSREAEIELSDGRYIATLNGTIPAGYYRVTAGYVPGSGNYVPGDDDVRVYHKNKTERSISVANKIDKKYGDASFTITPQLSEVGGSNTWTYSIVHDHDHGIKVKKEGGGYEDITRAITVSNVSNTGEGTIDISHAGSAVIEIKVTDSSNVYEDAYAYVTVNVSKAPLSVTSYAYKENGQQRTRITDAVYGKLDDAEYGLDFSGFVKDDTASTFTHGLGTLSAVPVAVEASAAGSPYDIGIAKNGVDIQIQTANDGSKNLSDVFICRDYDIAYTEGKLSVNKATLAVKADDSSGEYGGTEPAYSWSIPADQGSCDGLAKWDSADAVFSTGPSAGLGGSQSYADLNAGRHEGIIKLTGGESANYTPEYFAGDLTVTPAGITDVGRFTVSVPDTRYNGSVQKQPVTVKDSSYKTGSEDKTLIEGTDYTVTYPDDSGMIHAGTVNVRVEGKGNYSGTVTDSYLIRRKVLEIRTESATKIWDGEPLTAAGVEKLGLVTGETMTARATGTITDIGSVPNSSEIEWNGSAKENDYYLFDNPGKLTVLPKKGKNSITAEGYTGVYDGETHYVHAEALIKGSRIEYSIDGGSSWTETAPGFRDARVEPYKVQIRATHEGYLNDGLAEAETVVIIRPAATGIVQSAVITDDNDTITVAVTAEVMGLHEEAGSVEFELEGPGIASKIVTSRPVTKGDDDGYTATLLYSYTYGAEPPAGKYTVKASYIPPEATHNYLGSSDTQEYTKAEKNRTVSIGDIEASYGDPEIRLNASTDHPGASDVWSCSLVWYSGSEISIIDGSGQPKKFEPAVSVSDDGTVRILHAGEALIKVTLKDGSGVYADASKFVRVNVARSRLTVRSYASKKSSSTVMRILEAIKLMLTGGPEAVYGELDDMEYGLEFTGLVNGDDKDTFTHGMGSLSAVPLALDSDAMDDPYPVMISRNGVDITIGGVKHSNVFISRDYDIEYITGGLRVVPASLTDSSRIRAEASDTVYNGRVQKQTIRVTDSAFGSEGSPKELQEGNDYTVSYPDDDDMVHAGTVKAGVSGNISGNYSGTVNVPYEIRKAPVEAVTQSAKKKYDGKPLTAGGSLSGLVPGETAEFTITGSRTKVGSSPNTYRLVWNGSAAESDYSLSENIGTLTVKKAGKNGRAGKGGSTGDHTALPVWIAVLVCAALELLILIRRHASGRSGRK